MHFSNFLSEFFPNGSDKQFNYNYDEEYADQELNELIQSDSEEEILVYIMSDTDNDEPVMVSAKPTELLGSFQDRSCVFQGSLYEMHIDNIEQQLCRDKSLRDNGITDGCILIEKMPIEISQQIAQLAEEFAKTEFYSDDDVIVFRELDLFLANYISPTISNGLLRYAVLLKDGSSLIHDPHLSHELQDITSSVLAGKVTVPAGSLILAISMCPEQIPFDTDLILLVMNSEDGVLLENRFPSNGLRAADLLSFYPVNPLTVGQLVNVVITDHRRGEQELLSFLVHVI